MERVRVELDQIKADITEAEEDIRRCKLQRRSVALIFRGLKSRLEIVENLIESNKIATESNKIAIDSEKHEEEIKGDKATSHECGMDIGTVFACATAKKLDMEILKDLLYEERQEIWIHDNNLKVGDKVRVIREAKHYEKGWGTHWVQEMSEMVGKLFEVDKLSGRSGISLHCIKSEINDISYYFPYFVLEKV